MRFDRTIYFDHVRDSLFYGELTQQQVDGQNAILDEYELNPLSDNLRHLAYPLATTLHETASTMWPIEEYGRGQGMEYGKVDPETGQTYYGRGYVQLTWRDNYAKATDNLGLRETPDDMEWDASRALDPNIAADVMFLGMWEGWFRSDSKGRQTLERYFNENVDDAYGAREIINGDKTKVPSWSDGVSIGNLIKGYHEKFLDALTEAAVDEPPVPKPPQPFQRQLIMIKTAGPALIKISVPSNAFVTVKDQ